MGRFQSPQWGSNSKAVATKTAETLARFQSPQWGSNSKDGGKYHEEN